MPYATAEARREWSKRYYHRERERVLGIKNAWKARNPEKVRANTALNNALRDGRITKTECQAEGEHHGRIEAHHEDYSKPLDVAWLCSKHHGETRVRG